MTLLEEILAVETKDELMELADEHGFEGEENDAVLKKALEFGDQMVAQDWLDLYTSSEDDTELERVADERAREGGL